MIWLLFFALVLVNQTVDISLSDALLDSCSGSVEISGNSKLVKFKGKVVARDANLEIIDSEIDNLYCYNSTIEAYHNFIRYVQLENCSLTASLNTFSVVLGNNSSYGNAVVTFTVLNKTMTEYVGNHWFLGSYANEIIDEDWDYVSDNIVCPLNIKIDGSHYCERVLRGLHVSYTFHGVEAVPKIVKAESSPHPENKEAEIPDSRATLESISVLIAFLAAGSFAVYLIARKKG